MRNPFMMVLMALVMALGLSGSAFAVDSPMTAIFAAVDLSTVATWVGTVGVLVIGIALAFKGIALGKRGIRAA